MKILYAGDAAAKIGPIFVASPFNVEVKGFSTHVWGQPLIDALEEGGIEVHHMTSVTLNAKFWHFTHSGSRVPNYLARTD
jgi:hypothetical protein